MWKFLLDPVFQGVAGVMVLAALAFVVFDLYQDMRDPTPASGFRTRGRRASASAGPARPRERVEPSVEMRTDAQGETTGRVRRGPSRGIRLEDMTHEQCEAQAAYCRDHDLATAPAMEAYIRYRFGQARRYEAPRENGMTRDQALDELGLSDGASRRNVHDAYRRLMMKHHPDHGGSHAKAARLNQAKAMLGG